VSEPLTEERREELRRIATFAKEHVQRTRMISLDEVDMLARGVLALLDERPSPADAGAIQAVSEVERLRRETADLREQLRDANMQLQESGMAAIERMVATSEPVFTAAQVREAVNAVADGRKREAEERGAREVLRNLGL
jgi:hypothetical protein